VLRRPKKKPGLQIGRCDRVRRKPQREGVFSMPSAAYFRRQAETCWSLSRIDRDPAASRRYRRMALDCLAKARELDIDEFQSRVMPVRKNGNPVGT